MGRSGATDAINWSRWAASLCRKMNRSAPERRIPSIIELWVSASEKIAQSGSSLPSVPSAGRFEIHSEVVVAAPHGDAAAPAVAATQQRGRELPCHPLQLDEGPVPAVRLHLADENFESPDV